MVPAQAAFEAALKKNCILKHSSHTSSLTNLNQIAPKRGATNDPSQLISIVDAVFRRGQLQRLHHLFGLFIDAPGQLTNRHSLPHLKREDGGKEGGKGGGVGKGTESVVACQAV